MTGSWMTEDKKASAITRDRSQKWLGLKKSNLVWLVGQAHQQGQHRHFWSFSLVFRPFSKLWHSPLCITLSLASFIPITKHCYPKYQLCPMSPQNSLTTTRKWGHLNCLQVGSLHQCSQLPFHPLWTEENVTEQFYWQFMLHTPSRADIWPTKTVLYLSLSLHNRCCWCVRHGL